MATENCQKFTPWKELFGKRIDVACIPVRDDGVAGKCRWSTTGLIVKPVPLVRQAAFEPPSLDGVEVGTQNIFRTTEKIQKPVIFAVNQLDGDKVDFDNVIQQMKDMFGNKIVLIQYPINPGTGFNAMIDVLLMKMYSWGPDGGVPTISEIPADQMEKAKELNKLLVEAAAENDENLMEKFFDQGVLTWAFAV